MLLLYMIMYLLAGVCFGLAVGNVHTRRLSTLNFLAAGALLWVMVEFLKVIVKF